jgi:uncharacterized protein
MQKNKLFDDYFSLRDELDVYCSRLYEFHVPHLMCKAGCDQCCMDFGMLPIEFFAIRQEAGERIRNGEVSLSESGCPFLIDHRCVIYQSRPFICRTQGLPLLFMNDDQCELSACELNFTEFDFDEFSEENTFPQDQYNSRLFLLNLKFIESVYSQLSPTDLLSLKDLFEDQVFPDKG